MTDRFICRLINLEIARETRWRAVMALARLNLASPAISKRRWLSAHAFQAACTSLPPKFPSIRHAHGRCSKMSSLFRFLSYRSRFISPRIHIPDSFLTFSLICTTSCFLILDLIMPFSKSLQIYAICAGGLFLSIILRRFLVFLWSVYFKFWFYKYLYHAFALRRHRVVGPISWFNLITISSLWISAAALNLINASSTIQLGANLGEIALTLFIPLIFGGEFTLATRILEVSLRLLRRIHLHLGALAFVSVIAHSILSGSKGPPFSISSIMWLYGVVVSQSSETLRLYVNVVQSVLLLALFPLMPLLRPRFSAFYSLIHRATALAIIISLWFHTMSANRIIIKTYIISAGSILVGFSTLYLIIFLLNNYKCAPIELEVKVFGGTDGEPSMDTELGVEDHNTGQKHITLITKFSGHINARAGQHVLLYVPSLTGFQSHALPICWWAQDPRMSLDFLIEPEHQLARALTRSPRSQTRAYFTGPHGHATDMDEYRSVALIATGYGISAQLSHVKQLVEARDNGTSRTRQIHLIWQFDSWGRFQ